MTRRSSSFILSCALTLGVACTSQGATLIMTGFEEGSFAASGLTDFSNLTAPTLTAGAGAAGSTGLDFGSDGAAVSDSQAIFATTAFSMMGRFNGFNNTSNGGMSFGWTQASADFNPFNGAGTGVSVTDHVVVGVARTAGNGFQLAAANGVSGALGSGALFGNAIAALTTGNWYRLEGTVLFNAATKQFTFNNISVDDFGATGASEVTANILSGTGAVVSAPSFGTTGRTLFVTNRDRGFQVTDNYTAIPEPSSAVLALAGVGMLLRRRRRE